MATNLLRCHDGDDGSARHVVLEFYDGALDFIQRQVWINAVDHNNFAVAHLYFRELPGELLLESLMTAMGTCAIRLDTLPERPGRGRNAFSQPTIGSSMNCRV